MRNLAGKSFFEVTWFPFSQLELSLLEDDFGNLVLQLVEL
jgi:hypothetical protein